MKILIVTQYFWPESFKVNDLAEELVARGHEVTVFTGLPNYPQGKFFDGYSFLKGPYKETYRGIKIIRAPQVPRGKGHGIKLILNYLSFCFIATLIAPFVVREKIDKIFMFEVSPIFSALPAVFLKFFKKAPLITWITDLWPESLEATGVVKNKRLLGLVVPFVKFIYRNSNIVYTSSKGFIPRIEALGIERSKLKYWPHWAEDLFSSYSPTLNQYSDPKLPKSCFIIMFAGNIGSAQDLPTIIAAMDRIKHQNEIHLVILGDGLMKKWVETEVAKKGLSSRVHLLGRKPLETMPYYYSMANVLLVSLVKTDLFSITLPSKLQSYLCSSKPVLAVLDGEGAELVNTWRIGLTCPAGDFVTLSEKIVEFSQLPKHELEEMGSNAFNCYKSQFDREKLMTSLETELKELRY